MIRFFSGSWLFPLIGAVAITGLILLGPEKIMDAYDIARMHQCYKADFRSAILAGEMPWWNPYTALGRPFFADVETACLYPPSWLVLPLGVTGGIIAMIGLHLAVAIRGMQKLGKSLDISPAFSGFAGISFAASGLLLGRIQAGQLHVFCVICLWPWLWWSTFQLQDNFSRRRLVQTSLCWALAFLAGSPQVLWCGAVVLAFALIARAKSLPACGEMVLKVGLAGILAAGLVAVQLWPFIELVQQGNRPLNDAGFATLGGESVAGWMTLIRAPGEWGRPDGEFNLHCGALVVIFAAVASFRFSDRGYRALTVAAIAAVLLALGNHFPLLPGLAKWVPGFAGVRYPSRYALGLAIILNLLAFGWLDGRVRENKIGRWPLTAILTLQAALLVAGYFVQEQIYRVPATPTNEAQLLADLKEEHLPDDAAPARVALPASLLRANAGGQAGISTLTGFNNPALNRTWTSLYVLAKKTPPTFHRAEVADDIIVKLGTENRYFSLSASATGLGHEVRFASPAGSRAFVSFAPTVVANWQDAVERVAEGHDFVRHALVEKAFAKIEPLHPEAEGRVRIVQFQRNRIVTECETNAPGLLVLAEAWYPGWTASIGGAEKGPSIPANGWMRATIVPAGRSQVIFEYRPTCWWQSVAVSVLSVFVALGLWGFKSVPSPRLERDFIARPDGAKA